MKIKELREKTAGELHKALEESREKLRDMRFNLAAGKVKNVREIRRLKKLIAHTLTIVKEKR